MLFSHSGCSLGRHPLSLGMQVECLLGTQPLGWLWLFSEGDGEPRRFQHTRFRDTLSLLGPRLPRLYLAGTKLSAGPWGARQRGLGPRPGGGKCWGGARSKTDMRGPGRWPGHCQRDSALSRLPYICIH